MRFRLDALFKPVDPVVAVHQSSRDADAALAALRRAGYGRGMLTVVGQSDASPDLDGLKKCPGPGVLHWAASGTCLGLAWAVFTIAAVLLVPAGGAAIATLATIGALTLALQTAVVAPMVKPEGDILGARGTATSRQVGKDGDCPAWRFLVVVHGTRSDVALARDILASH